MSKFIHISKLVLAVAVGIAAASLVLLLVAYLVMPDSSPLRAVERLFVVGLAGSGALAFGAAVFLFYAGWREADAEHSMRPLADPEQTRFRVAISEGRKFGIMDVTSHATTGVVVGQDKSEPLPITPVSFNHEPGIMVQFPTPQPHQDEDIRTWLHSNN